MSAALVMSTDLEMLMSRSPPTFSHSPPAGFLIDYCNTSAFSVNSSTSAPRIVTAANITHTHKFTLKTPTFGALRSASCTQITSPTLTAGSTTSATPRRPCLVVRDATDETISSEKTQKKKVVFADDKGMSLTQVRVMTEPSNVPPLWSLRFLSQVTKGISAEPLPEPWELTFIQPASDYLDFRHRLDTGNVSLENVIVRESEAAVIGTVKVKNIAFKKEVFVRSTSNNWATHEDTFCTYVDNLSNLPSCSSSVYVLYDTFSFKLTLPPKSRRMEFCICFRCEGKEYWDNNIGKNYNLIKKAQISPPFQKSISSESVLKNQKNQEKNAESPKTTKYTDISQTRIDTWSEFASWTHLDTQGPYW